MAAEVRRLEIERAKLIRGEKAIKSRLSTFIGVAAIGAALAYFLPSGHALVKLFFGGGTLGVVIEYVHLWIVRRNILGLSRRIHQGG